VASNGSRLTSCAQATTCYKFPAQKMWPASMPRKRPATTRTRPRYAPPADTDITTLTIGQLLSARRPLTVEGQQGLAFQLAERPVWCAGDESLLQRPCVAIVGTRDVSEAGAMRARRLAKELARRGVVVVSGLAKGVDTEALTAAITAGGKVIAVIGTPIDKAYPIENASLQEAIARDHLLVSPFAPGQRTFPSHFPERNRVMAALSDATAIIEASDTSGTLHQAAECLRLGRWLFIAKNVMDDTTLMWPSRFLAYDRTRTLSDIADLNPALQLP
jgi:DNA processing protein